MGSRSGFDANLDLDELQLPVDRGSGGVAPGTRLTNAATNLGEQSLIVGSTPVALVNNVATAQNLFATGHSAVTLRANTAYYFMGQVEVATGATTHTTALGFVVSTALASIAYIAWLQSMTSGTISTTAASMLDVNVATATVLNATSTATLTVIQVEGMLVTGAADTTVTPQITFSAGPTGTCQVKSGSFFLCWPVVSQ